MPAYAKVLTAFAPFLQLLTGATLLNLSPFFCACHFFFAWH
jgi:hypothetical protein